MTSTKPGGLACLLVLFCACSREGNPPTDTPSLPASGTGAATIPDTAHSSRNSLDWSGTYSGVTPCADCPGIRTTVTLHVDGSFERTLVYLERSVAPHVDTGQFSWDAAGSAVTLQEPGGDDGQQYKVGENTLSQLDRDGNPITGDLAGRYLLQKHLRDPAVEGRQWTLIELGGKPVEAGPRRPFLLLDAKKAIAGGNASCNSFSGTYAIKSGNRISFDGDFAVTMMACPDMSTEQQFLEVLRKVGNYAVADGILSLNRARMAPLARFHIIDE